MQTKKKALALLLSLIMIVSLMGGVFTVNAADAVAITPTASYNGAALTMTATGVADKFTLFDLAAIGFGTAKEYAFWFDADGTFSFDQDVALSYQGQTKAELKAGEVYSINGCSECYVILDDGNMLALIDSANPGNFASLTADKDYSEFPGTVGAAGASAGDGFKKVTSLDADKEYLIVAEAGGKYYALNLPEDSAAGDAPDAVEVTVSGDTVAEAPDTAIWLPDGAGHLENNSNRGLFIFAGSGGFMVWDDSVALRTFTYDASAETVALHGGKYSLTFDGAKFNQGDPTAASKVILFAKARTADAEPVEEDPFDHGDPFEKTDKLEEGREYIVAASYGGKYYAFAYDGALKPLEITVDGDTVVNAPVAAIWLRDSGNAMKHAEKSKIYVYAGSNGLSTYSSGRAFNYDADAKAITMHTVPYYLTFDGTAFDESTNAADACTVVLFGRGEATKPLELSDFVPPKTVERSAVKNADGSIVLGFTSDIHNDGKHLNIKTWLEAAEAEVGYIDAFGSCGDMGSAYASSAATYWSYVQDVFDYFDDEIDAGDIGDVIYTTGNHEWFLSGSAGGDFGHEYFSGNYPGTQRFRIVGPGIVTDDYIIYCFGAGETAMAGQDYRYLQSEIDEFAAWLETAPTDIPIFVLTHYPLHKWGGRGEERMQGNAAEIIDMLNGHRNVVVLWGHNHSNFDDNYYQPLFPGDEMVIDANNNTKTINFTYLAAGATADIEYTGPEAGSAACMNKGLIVTINADGSLDYKYYTIDGEVMPIESPWLVRFRTAYGDYEVFDTQHVKDGQSPEDVTPPALDGYDFAGWYTWKGVDGSATEVEFDFDAPITKNTLVTAKYANAPVDAPDAEDCIAVTPDATFKEESLTMTATGVDDQITVFDLSSIGYGQGIMYGFWFDADGVVSFNRDVTLYYQGKATYIKLKTGEFYSVKGLSEHYVSLDDGNSILLLEKEDPGNYANLPGDQPYSAFPGTIVVPGTGAADEDIPNPDEVILEDEKAISAARNAYEALSEEEKADFDIETLEKCEEALAKIKEGGEQYNALSESGDLAEVNPQVGTSDGSTNGSVFVIQADGDIEKLHGVSVDGKKLTPVVDYIAVKGSTIIYLTEQFIKNLGDGEHDISVYFDDGYASASFELDNAVFDKNKKSEDHQDLVVAKLDDKYIFQDITIDEDKLAESDFTLEKSTIVIHTEFLDTLDKGKHDVGIGYIYTVNDDTVVVHLNLTVKDSSSSGGSSSGGSSGGGSSKADDYKITIKDTEHGTVTASKKRAVEGKKITLTVTPDKGWELDTLQVTTAKGKEVTLTAGDGNTCTFKMPASNVTVTAAFKQTASQEDESPSPVTPVNPYVDVDEDAYYYDAVMWAHYSEPQITNGMDATHFGPDKTTTRAHIVTFLWRAKGCAEPVGTENPFEDVKESDYFYKAVLWAVEQGIVKGTDATHFTPDQTCSTAHIVTMLYRALGAGTDGWYEEAGAWATKLGLLEDTGLTVDKDVDCPRGAIVTFLYRALAGK